MRVHSTNVRLGLMLLCVLVLFCVASVAWAADLSDRGTVSVGKGEAVAGEILVKFKPGASAAQIRAVNARHGNRILSSSGLGGFKRISVPPGRTVQQMVAVYQASPLVEYAEPNFVARALIVPNDPYYGYQWHFDDQTPGGNPYGGANGGGINLEPAWDLTTGSGAVVAVVDTGVAYEDYIERVDRVKRRYYRAPDLASTTFVAGYDFVNNDTHPNDDDSHGTHVTGTIAQSTNNYLGVAGIAPNCAIMPVKVLDQNGEGSYADVADGIRFAADNGADVINLSLGGTAISTTLEQAVAYAYQAGVTIVCAAGNDGDDLNLPNYPAAYDAYCIAVGGTRYDETVASYSNTGSYIDIAAPGGDMTVDQNGDAYADGVLQNTFNPNSGNTGDFGYWFFEGTSMATSHVSGVAALLISAGASGPDAVRNLLESTAEDKGPAGWDADYGWGIVDARAALNATLVPNNPPVADANGPYTGTEDIPVTFDGSGSYDPDTDPLTYSWNFGDGDSGTGVSPTHAYTAGGAYTVTLVVNDGLADSAADTTTVTVTEVNDPPAADAGPNQSGLVGETLTFDGSGSDDPDGTIVSYAWDFGDTATASGATVTHAYAAAGTYTVTLTVTDNLTATDSDTATVTITEAPPVQTMYVNAIDMSLVTRGRGRKVYATATVNVADEYGSPVGSATVNGHWENATSDSDSGATNSSGAVSFKSGAVKLPPSGTTFTFVVDDVVKTGWVYDDSGSVTEGSVSVP